MNWIILAQDRDQWRADINTIVKLCVPQNTGNSLNNLTAIRLSKRALFHGVVQRLLL